MPLLQACMRRMARFTLSARVVTVPTRLQFQTTECGVAALAMMLAHYGRHVSMEELRQASGASRDCTNAADMVRAARHFGLVAKAYTREPAALKELRFPFVVHTRFIHFTVVEGITDTHILINDPYCGRTECSLDEFDEMFTGIVITMEPGEEFRRSYPAPSPLRQWWQRAREGSARATRHLWLAAVSALTATLSLLFIAHSLGRSVDRGGVTLAEGGQLLLAGAALCLLAAVFSAALASAQTCLAAAQTRALASWLQALPFNFFAYRLPARLQATIYAASNASQVLCGELLPVLLRLPGVLLLLGALWSLSTPVGILLSCICLLYALALCLLFRWRSGAARNLDEETGRDFAHLA
ncbi:MAG: cysteine peptidase family C39 domain-containing protein, partial [Burkholderiales bacterium]